MGRKWLLNKKAGNSDGIFDCVSKATEHGHFEIFFLLMSPLQKSRLDAIKVDEFGRIILINA